jgi:hypothetical protein
MRDYYRSFNTFLDGLMDRFDRRAAYERGWDDFGNGVELRECPYPADSADAAKWREGWNAHNFDLAN